MTTAHMSFNDHIQSLGIELPERTPTAITYDNYIPNQWEKFALVTKNHTVTRVYHDPASPLHATYLFTKGQSTIDSKYVHTTPGYAWIYDHADSSYGFSRIDDMLTLFYPTNASSNRHGNGVMPELDIDYLMSKSLQSVVKSDYNRARAAVIDKLTAIIFWTRYYQHLSRQENELHTIGDMWEHAPTWLSYYHDEYPYADTDTLEETLQCVLDHHMDHNDDHGIAELYEITNNNLMYSTSDFFEDIPTRVYKPQALRAMWTIAAVSEARQLGTINNIA